jgi:tRNA threonylcarbamoyl adenosine modification protein YeaZ
MKSAPILALDTSGSYCSVALHTSEGAVVHEESDGAGDHFERLPGLVDAVLSKADVVASELGELRIGVGPGSFTGLRIGMSFAKGFSVSARVPLRGVSSFEGIAWSVCSQWQDRDALDILVISDARRGEVFLCSYRYESKKLLQGNPTAITPVSFVAEWRQGRSDGVVVTSLREHDLQGVGAIKVVPRIAEGLLKVECPQGQVFELHEIALLEPAYLRAVAAKSIAERAGA